MFDALLKALPLALSVAVCGCAHVTPPTPDADAAPRAALAQFLAAQQSGDFEKAYTLLAAPLRARYTPRRLQADYQRDQALAADKLARARAALASGVPFEVSGESARLPLGPGRAVQLVSEDGAWRILSLE